MTKLFSFSDDPNPLVISDKFYDIWDTPLKDLTEKYGEDSIIGCYYEEKGVE